MPVRRRGSGRGRANARSAGCLVSARSRGVLPRLVDPPNRVPRRSRNLLNHPKQLIPNWRFIHRLGLSWADASRARVDSLICSINSWMRPPAAAPRLRWGRGPGWRTPRVRGGWPPSPTSSSGCGLLTGPPSGSCGASTTGMRWRRRWPPPSRCRWGWPRINSASPWSCGTCRGSAQVFAAGAISYRVVAAVIARTRLIRDRDARAKVDSALAARIGGWGPLSVAKTETEIDYWVDRYDPAAVRRSEDHARGRHVDVHDGHRRQRHGVHRGAAVRRRRRSAGPAPGRDGPGGVRR